EQSLAEAVVDLVRAGVQQVFAFEVDFCSAQGFREALGKVERRGASGVVAQQRIESSVEGGVGLRLGVGVLEFVERGDQRLRHITAAVGAESPGDLRNQFSGAHQNVLSGQLKSRDLC